MYGYGYGYYSMFDPTMILVLIGVFLSLGASAKVKSTYARFSRVRSMTGMTGAEAARQLLNSQGIYDVQIRQVAGSLTDHYDPRTKTVNLSESVYGSTSVAAIGVAAHECGHAMQDASEYVPLRLRGSMVPVVNIGAQLSWPMILIGVLVGGMGSPIVSLGILLFSLSVLFQLHADSGAADEWRFGGISGHPGTGCEPCDAGERHSGGRLRDGGSLRQPGI